MYMHQKITMPKLHGDGPQNLSMVIRRPQAPNVQKKFKNFKDAMEYYKEQDEEEKKDEG